MRARRFPRSLLFVAAGAMVTACGSHGHSSSGQYEVRNLVSDGFVAAEHVDAQLVNPWGIAPDPAGTWWVADNETDVATLYDSEGVKQSLVVSLPGGPTGIVRNDGSGFVVSNGTAGAPARFLVATEAGTILGWNIAVPAPTSTTSFVVVDRSSVGANYKGLAIAGDRLFAADFHNARVDVFDDSFQLLSLPDTFTAPGVPAGYAPFGIQAIGGLIYVAYAQQDALAEDEVTGPGLGFIEIFTQGGAFVEEVATDGVLNAPWGMALAPESFGVRGGDLLVGNFGDGQINAFRRDGSGWHSEGKVVERGGGPVQLDGLWGIAFGAGGATGPVDTLFFAAGPEDEVHGLFGRIDPKR